jgi:predicted ATPase
MKCNVTNVGRFESAELILDGLTVVAGPNSSGKTTLGKAIYAATKCEIALLDNIRLNHKSCGILGAEEFLS